MSTLSEGDIVRAHCDKMGQAREFTVKSVFDGQAVLMNNHDELMLVNVDGIGTWLDISHRQDLD